jgi:hypothetical protein
MMNAEQIIKGLEGSISIAEAYYDRLNIPKEMRPSENKKALELIKGQKAEIERLNVVVDAMKGEIDAYKMHNENLQKENKYLRESLADEREHKEDCFFSVDFDIKALKTDTVKKMQELIKERCIEGGIYPAFVASTIDKIAKEILEDKK